MPRGRPRVLGPGNAKGKAQFKRQLRRAAPKSKKAITSLITSVVKRLADTKMVTWYSGGTNPLGTGSRSAWLAEPHNAQITSNTTDIMRLLPLIVAGTGDNQRIGERVSPSSFRVDGVLSMNQTNVLAQVANQDFVAVLYVLQHKSLKTYNSLQTGPNDFTQLLLTGEGDTKSFDGHPFDASLPVASQYYKVCAKKIIPLRYAGVTVSPAGGSLPGGAVGVSVANSHTWSAKYSINLKKHIPKVLRFQESGVTTGQPNDPLNSSIFMCVGYYRMDQLIPGNAAYISNSYVAKLTYKDL